MPLSHPLLVRSARLRSAAENNPPLRAGERGDAVVRLQVALIAMGQTLPRSTKNQTAFPDGGFGSETSAAVSAFQRSQKLGVDGAAGKDTLAALNRLLPMPRRKDTCCGNCADNGTRTSTVKQSFAGANFRALGATIPLTGITLPTGVRALTAGQVATVTGVFGTSMDLTRVFLSDGTGASGRPFTMAVDLGIAGSIVIINAGTFSPGTNLLIHEMTHAWQSQHSPLPTQFMINSVESQGIAEALGLLGIDASAYYFKPGRSFALYGAEQIACQVEKGVAAIVSSVKSLPPFIPHPGNVAGLAAPHWEVAGPGIDTSC
jgi:peptidoglycan hydrolase-like protein with peptidoglycan-binding domain